jgi:hypothetical protein
VIKATLFFSMAIISSLLSSYANTRKNVKPQHLGRFSGQAVLLGTMRTTTTPSGSRCGGDRPQSSELASRLPPGPPFLVSAAFRLGAPVLRKLVVCSASGGLPGP